jgi:hypothetical protein
MAKVYEEILIVKLSKLVKETADVDSIVSQETLEQLTSVVEELAGPGIVVEIEKP